MPNIAILLDGDSTRRLVKRWVIRKNPNPTEIKIFCESFLFPEETIVETIFYDCSPFSEKRNLPISGNSKDFSKDTVFDTATNFQSKINRNEFFRLRKGNLSFSGWNLKPKVIEELKNMPRVLTDDDFRPILLQKQVDMRIAIDIARIALTRTADKILLSTCDSDFIPTIDYAKSLGVEVILLFDEESIIKGSLKAACSFRRRANDFIRAKINAENI